MLLSDAAIEWPIRDDATLPSGLISEIEQLNCALPLCPRAVIGQTYPRRWCGEYFNAVTPSRLFNGGETLRNGCRRLVTSAFPVLAARGLKPASIES